MSQDEIRVRFDKAGQGHVFQFLDKLTPEEANALFEDVKDVDLDYISKIHKKTADAASQITSSKMSHFPSKNICNMKGSADQRARWEQIGYEKIAEGKVATLLLAGGQGTRLGTVLPKGMYNIGLPSGKCLYQIQAERLLRLEKQVGAKFGKTVQIPWYIMTSEATGESTKKYFEKNNYFGLKVENVLIFEQFMLPCLTPEGKIILEKKNKIARAPNGNGGLYEALKLRGVLSQMKSRGVEFLYQYCVDNSLVKMADPIFVGYCFDKKADCAAKVVAKLNPKEPVGILCLRDGKPGVMEYSEIDEKSATMTNPDGSLYYNESHVCMNGFSVDFVDKIANRHLHDLPFHIAKKKIPTVNPKGEEDSVNGWKLELFIFDVFEFADNMFALQVEREEEFSPLKNGPGAGADCPETCRAHLSKLHRKIIENCGGKVDIASMGDDQTLVEISPLVCCSTEDTEIVEKLVKGKTFTTPVEIK